MAENEFDFSRISNIQGLYVWDCFLPLSLLLWSNSPCTLVTFYNFCSNLCFLVIFSGSPNFSFYKIPKLFGFSRLSLWNILHVSRWVFRNSLTAVSPTPSPRSACTLPEVTPLTGGSLYPLTGYTGGLKALSFHPNLEQLCWAIPAPVLPVMRPCHSPTFLSAHSCPVTPCRWGSRGLTDASCLQRASRGLLRGSPSEDLAFVFQAWFDSPSFLFGLWRQNAPLFKNDGT